MRIILILISVQLSDLVLSQNIFDAEHSFAYAKHLEINKKYSEALKEYENVIKLQADSNNELLQLKVIKLCLLTSDKQYAIQKIESFYPSINNMPLLYANKYCRLLLLTKQISKLDTVLNNNIFLNDSIKYFYRFNKLILNNNYKEIKNIEIAYPTLKKNYQDIIFEIKTSKTKSPFIAATMSAIIPGMGKIYTGNTRDGLFSMLIIAVNAFEAYRGFNKYGTSSVLGWISGGIAVGYYTGGIYGSWKAAGKHNNEFNNKIKNETDEILLSDF